VCTPERFKSARPDWQNGLRQQAVLFFNAPGSHHIQGRGQERITLMEADFSPSPVSERQRANG